MDKRRDIHGTMQDMKSKKDTIRNSNLELLRIVIMLLIVLHHYVVNSGISDLYDFSHITGNMIFTQIVGCAGKQE